MSNIKKQQQQKKANIPIILAPAQYQLEPFHVPLPAAKTMHYPLPVDRHIKPKILNMHIQQSNPLVVFSDLNVGVEEMGWGGWKTNPSSSLNEWDEALISEDIVKLQQLEQQQQQQKQQQQYEKEIDIEELQ